MAQQLIHQREYLHALHYVSEINCPIAQFLRIYCIYMVFIQII